MPNARRVNRTQPATVSGTFSPLAAASRLAVYFASLRSLFAVEADAIEFQPVVDQAITELGSNLLLQGFNFRIDEFHDFAGFHVDQMIMMGFRRGFVTGTAIAKIMAIENARLFEKPDGTIDRGN